MAKTNKPRPNRVPSKEAMKAYEEHDGEWRKIGLTAPARKALVEARLYRVSDLRNLSVEELMALDGMSKSAVARLRVIMEAKKMRFR